MSPPESEAIAVGLDLGSSYVKSALLDRSGRTTAARAHPAPPLRGSGTTREGDAEEYARIALEVLIESAGQMFSGTPLGIASQRSSFVLWDRFTGATALPMISWQDRRAADWCTGHGDLQADLARRTGLQLSAHYVGPKLAAMQGDDRELAAELRRGRLLFGTLDCYLLWRWTGQEVHEIDRTIAARTMLVELEGSDWSPDLLELFGVPRMILPRIVPSTGRRVVLDIGLEVTASLADQAAGAIAVFEDKPSTLLNLGTGAFVLRPVEGPIEPTPGYLVGPLLAPAEGATRYALEGTINGVAPALDRFRVRHTLLPATDPAPDAFCIPDASGLGSPYWKPEIGLTWSDAARRLDGAGKRRVVVEGLLFRILQIVEDLAPDSRERVLVSGGLAREKSITQGLAAVLDRPVEVLDLEEAALLGIARLAAGMEPYAAPPTTHVAPTAAGAYLREKFRHWRRWLDTRLG